jgi:hypothetical protein
VSGLEKNKIEQHIKGAAVTAAVIDRPRATLIPPRAAGALQRDVWLSSAFRSALISSNS